MTEPSVLEAIDGSNLKWLRERTIFLTKHGSQAYGTSTPESDTDYKGIVIEPPEYYLGMNQSFEQAEFHKPDAVLFSLRKFMKLAADCNPSIIEVLFTDESDWLVPQGGAIWGTAFQRLLNARNLFLSKKARYTFSGYAMSQLKRIRGHHRWLVNPPGHEPTRAEFGLPEITVISFDQLLAAESAIKKEMDALYNLDIELDEAGNVKMKEGLEVLRGRVTAMLAESKDQERFAVGRRLGFDTNFLLLLEHERAHKNARIEWEQYQNWKATRNPARASLEAKFGYDTKHAMHLVRLMRMGTEILEGKGVVVKRPDAQELLAIRAGAWTYEQLDEWAKSMETRFETAYQESKLPHGADKKALESLCVDIYKEFNHRGVI